MARLFQCTPSTPREMREKPPSDRLQVFPSSQTLVGQEKREKEGESLARYSRRHNDDIAPREKVDDSRKEEKKRWRRARKRKRERERKTKYHHLSEWISSSNLTNLELNRPPSRKKKMRSREGGLKYTESEVRE